MAEESREDEGKKFVEGTLGPCFVEPFSSHVLQFSNLLGAIRESRETMASQINLWLFGHEVFSEKIMNDTGAALRSSLSGLGFDATKLMGEAPKRPAPHAQLGFRRSGGKPVNPIVTPLQQPPDGEPAPQEVRANMKDYSEAWLSCYNLNINREVADAGKKGNMSAWTGGLLGGTREEFSEFRMTAALGAHATLVEEGVEIRDRHVAALWWLAQEGGDPLMFKKAFMDAFPHVTAFWENFIDTEAAVVRREEMPSGAVKISLDATIRVGDETVKFPQLTEVLSMMAPLHIGFTHPETGATFLRWSVEDGKTNMHFYMWNGELAWQSADGKTVTPAVWDKDGKWHSILEFALSVQPAGLKGTSLPPIPMPSVKLSVHGDIKGKLDVKCIEAGEPILAGVASATAFDVVLLRKLLVETFHHQVCFVKVGEDRHAVRMYQRFGFPSSSVNSLIVEWFKDFVSRQVMEMDTVNAFRAFSEAMAIDSRKLGENFPPRVAAAAAPAAES